MTFPQQVAAWVDAQGLIPAGSSILVAFSGGADSCALLDVLNGLATSRAWRLQALHLDHGLRAASAAEAQRAVSLAEAIGVGVHVQRLNLEGGGNVQERAREARLAALEQRARNLGCSWVALGHTADDQAETVLMRLVRGTGPAGLGGMAPKRGVFVRPLLGQRRGEILAHLERRGLGFVEDPSNRDRRYLRVRARKEWIPLLEQSNPQLVLGISRLAERARQEGRALDALIESLLRERWTSGQKGEFGRVDLAGLPGGETLLASLLRGAYARVMGSPRGLGAAHVEQLEALHGKGGSRGIDLPGMRVELRYRQMVLLPEAVATEPLEPLPVTGPGRYRLNSGSWLAVREGASSGALDELPRERLVGPVVLRGPMPGDRMCIGPQRSRRVARILIDAKVEQATRARRPMVVHDGEPLLIVGQRRAAGWTPPEGAAVWRFTISP